MKQIGQVNEQKVTKDTSATSILRRSK